MALIATSLALCQVSCVVLINPDSFIVYSILSIYVALCSAAASLPSSLICIALISAPSNIVDLYSAPFLMTYIVSTIAACTLLCDFICICLWGRSSHMLKCIMSLPWATFLHCGASFCDPPYTLLQSNFIALTVVCDILNVSSHCNILSASLWMCCCSLIIVALHRTTGSLPLYYLHHLPWCFLDELVLWAVKTFQLRDHGMVSLTNSLIHLLLVPTHHS